jgi:hypothetical protein
MQVFVAAAVEIAKAATRPRKRRRKRMGFMLWQ